MSYPHFFQQYLYGTFIGTKQMWNSLMNSDQEENDLNHHFYHSEILLTDFIGHHLTSATDVLLFLLNHQTIRRRILREAITVPPRERRAALLSHPLLLLPIFLHPYDNDRSFCEKIIEYLQLRVIEQWVL
jgi:hypothetical protein